MARELWHGEEDSDYQIWRFDNKEEAQAFYDVKCTEFDTTHFRWVEYAKQWEVELGYDPDEMDDYDPDRELRRQTMNEVMERHPDMAFTGQQVRDYLDTGDMEGPYIDFPDPYAEY